jgi:hypothetical protein
MGVTTRHKKAAKNIGKYRTEAEALLMSDYSKSYAKSGNIKKTKGWQELMDEALPDEELLRVHKEGLRATKDNEPDFKVRREYLSEAYKTKGKYAAEKHITLDLNYQQRMDEEKKRVINDLLPDESDKRTD